MQRLSSVRGMVPGEIVSELAQVIADDAAFAAFKADALNEVVWSRAKADPAGYFRSRRVHIPESIEISFTDYKSLQPWPDLEPELQMVVVRCWWVWGRADSDSDPVPPFHFCLEVPAFLLQYV